MVTVEVKIQDYQGKLAFCLACGRHYLLMRLAIKFNLSNPLKSPGRVKNMTGNGKWDNGTRNGFIFTLEIVENYNGFF